MNRQSDKTTALYCRLANFTEMDSLTAKHQMDQLAAYAAENGLQNPEFFCDWGFSGTNTERPEYQRMLQEIEARNVSDLVTMNVNRLWRDFVSGYKLYYAVLPDYGVTLHSLQDNIIVTPQAAKEMGARHKKLLALFQRESQRGGRK